MSSLRESLYSKLMSTKRNLSMVPTVLASQVDKEAKKAVDRIPLIKPHNTEATYNLNSVHLKQVLDGTSLIGNAYNGISVKESEKFFESQLSTFKDSDEKIKLLNNLLKTNRHFAFLFTINPQFRNKILDKMGNVNFSIEQSKMIKTTLKESLKEYQKYFDTEHKHTSKLYPAFSIASFFTLGIMYIPYVGFRNITGNNLLKDTYKHSNITLNATYPDAKPVNTTKSSSTNELLDILYMIQLLNKADVNQDAQIDSAEMENLVITLNYALESAKIKGGII